MWRAATICSPCSTQRVAERLPELSRSRLSIRLGSRLSVDEVLAAAARPAIRAFLGVEECAQVP